MSWFALFSIIFVAVLLLIIAVLHIRDQVRLRRTVKTLELLERVEMKPDKPSWEKEPPPGTRG